MINGKVTVGITQGDSNGIGYEVIIKALSDPRILDQFIPVVYGSPKLFGFYRKTIPEIEQIAVNEIPRVQAAKAGAVNIVNCLARACSPSPARLRPSRPRLQWLRSRPRCATPRRVWSMFW